MSEEIENFDVVEWLENQEKHGKEVDGLIARHEAFKKKGLKLNDQDMFDRIKLWEEMKDKITELKSVYYEEKQENDVNKGMRLVELKAMLDENNKKKYTDATADAVIRQEFRQRENEISIHKLQAELLQNKADTVQEYINIVKIHMKKDFSM